MLQLEFNPRKLQELIVLQFVQQIAAFQVDGQFSSKRFAQALREIGHTKDSFLKGIEEVQLIGQLNQALVQSGFILPKEIQQFVRFIHQKRDFSYLELKAEDFLQPVDSFSQEALRAYYETHLANFQVPEKVSVDYIVLSYQDILKEVKKNASDETEGSIEKKAGETFKAATHHLAELNKAHPRSLEEIAKTLHRAIQSTPLFTRQGGAVDIVKHPEVISAAFSENVLKGNNSPLLEIDSEHVVLLRMKQHEPLRLPAFDEVEDKVKEQLNWHQAKEKVQAYGEKLKDQIQKDPTVSAASGWHKLEKVQQDNTTLSPPILRTAFTMPHPGRNAQVKGVAMPNGNYAIVRLLKVHPGKVSQLEETQYERYKTELKQMMGELDYAQYGSANEKRVKIDYSSKVGI